MSDRQAIVSRRLDNGRVLDVLPLTFGRARLVVSADEHTMTYDDGY